MSLLLVNIAVGVMVILATVSFFVDHKTSKSLKVTKASLDETKRLLDETRVMLKNVKSEVDKNRRKNEFERRVAYDKKEMLT